MREIPIACPGSVSEALEELSKDPEARLIAGGTDLLVQLQGAAKPPPLLISLHRIKWLGDITVEDDSLRLGAGVSLARLAREPAVREATPLVAMAASTMASPPVRSRGTIGGNLCNASPAADLAPPLLVHDAAVVLRGPDGERELPLSSFLSGPGETALGEVEMLTEVIVPRLPADMLVAHRKHQVGVCGNLSIISIALGLAVEDDLCREARVALGAVAPTAVRYPEVEAKLAGTALDGDAVAAAAALASRSCSPIDDIRSSCDHRCRLVEVLIPRAVADALAQRV